MRFNGNNIFMSIDGTSVGAEWIEYELTTSVEEVDTTRGAAQTNMQRNAGLNDQSLTITLAYDPEKIQTQIAYLKPGVHHVVLGPEGNAAGKPRHEQEFLFTEAPFGQTVKKDQVVFTISASAADAPVADFFSGAVFS